MFALADILLRVSLLFVVALAVLLVLSGDPPPMLRTLVIGTATVSLVGAIYVWRSNRNARRRARTRSPRQAG